MFLLNIAVAGYALRKKMSNAQQDIDDKTSEIKPVAEGILLQLAASRERMRPMLKNETSLSLKNALRAKNLLMAEHKDHLSFYEFIR